MENNRNAMPNQKMLCQIVSLVFLISLGTGSWAGETGTVIRADSLKSESSGSATSTDKINPGDQVEIIDRQGAWFKVKLRQATGWVRLLSVKRGEATKSGSATDVLKLATGQAGTGQVTAVAGIRGLSEEELKTAKFNAQELNLLKSNSINAEKAQQLALAAGLQARQMEYLPAPFAPESTKPQGVLGR